MNDTLNKNLYKKLPDFLNKLEDFKLTKKEYDFNNKENFDVLFFLTVIEILRKKRFRKITGETSDILDLLQDDFKDSLEKNTLLMMLSLNDKIEKREEKELKKYELYLLEISFISIKRIVLSINNSLNIKRKIEDDELYRFINIFDYACLLEDEEKQDYFDYYNTCFKVDLINF